MAKLSKTNKKQPESAKLMEDPNALRERLTSTEEFLEKNRKWVFLIGGALVVLIAAFFGFKYYVDKQNSVAQVNMFQAQYFFEADSLSKALNGDGNSYGFLEIIDEYPMTEAANLAHFYSGVSFLKLGEYEEAISHLKKFKAKDLLLQARAYALIGDGYMELENYSESAKYYSRASNYKPNKFFTPTYLMKGALANELNGDKKAAVKNLETLINEFGDSEYINEAKRELARLNGELSSN